MEIAKHLTGIQHLGLPTNDIEKTISFYEKLGFTVAMRTVNEAAGEKVAFLQLHNLFIETYENGCAAGVPGAVDHIALDTTDVDAVFEEARKGGLKLLDSEVQFLPFWEHGVRFFTIQGPNGEKIEFNQKL